MNFIEALKGIDVDLVDEKGKYTHTIAAGEKVTGKKN